MINFQKYSFVQHNILVHGTTWLQIPEIYLMTKYPSTFHIQHRCGIVLNNGHPYWKWQHQKIAIGRLDILVWTSPRDPIINTPSGTLDILYKCIPAPGKARLRPMTIKYKSFFSSTFKLEIRCWKYSKPRFHIPGNNRKQPRFLDPGISYY